MKRLLRTTLGAFVVLTGACSLDLFGGKSERLEFAIAERSCGAADGPAVNILLSSTGFTSSPEPPYVRIWIEESITRIAGTTWSLPDRASAWYQTGDGGETATSGTVVVNSIGPDSSIAGSASILFGGRRIVSDFTAKWRSSTLLCG